jgi:hypothetical protein
MGLFECDKCGCEVDEYTLLCDDCEEESDDYPWEDEV